MNLVAPPCAKTETSDQRLGVIYGRGDARDVRYLLETISISMPLARAPARPTKDTRRVLSLLRMPRASPRGPARRLVVADRARM